jgi:cell division protein ZapA
MGKSRFEAKIMGKTYTITSEQDQAHMKAVVDLANQQLAQIANQSAQLTTEQAAVLLALNALSDQLKMQTEKDQQA